MKTYIAGLRQTVEQENATRKQERRQAADDILSTTLPTPDPLEDQIKALMASIPPAQTELPWLMDDLVKRLQGRYHERPHAQHVADALRRLKWRRERIYGPKYGGRRLWLPPDSQERR